MIPRNFAEFDLLIMVPSGTMEQLLMERNLKRDPKIR